jgi:hypothetical protein
MAKTESGVKSATAIIELRARARGAHPHASARAASNGDVSMFMTTAARGATIAYGATVIESLRAWRLTRPQACGIRRRRTRHCALVRRRGGDVGSHVRRGATHRAVRHCERGGITN